MTAGKEGTILFILGGSMENHDGKFYCKQGGVKCDMGHTHNTEDTGAFSKRVGKEFADYLYASVRGDFTDAVYTQLKAKYEKC